MIARTRMIITALVACHLFLLPGVLTSQLRPPEQPDISDQAASQSSSSQSPSVPATPVQSQSPDNAASDAEPAVRPPTGKSQVTVKTDTGQEDKQTEQVIQQVIQSSANEQESGPPRPSMNVPLGKDEVLIRGDQQEKNQDIYKARGHVVMRFRTYTLHADEITYDSTTGQVTANGHVVFDGGPHDDHLVGTHASYDVTRDTGVFYDVVGSSGVKVKNRDMFLTSSTPFFFTGKVVDKLGPDHYKVNHGYITSCQLPKPKWQFNSDTANVEMGAEATMHRATLRIRGIPVFYFPWVQHPADNFGRQSGFLMPIAGVSNTRGFILGDAFYWAINRSNDATLGASLYSARGWAQHGIFRSIGYNYQFKAEYFGVIDEKGVPQGQPGAGQKQGGEELRANGSIMLPDEFRGVLSVDYLSSFLFRLAFAQGFTLTSISSEVRNYGFLSKNWNGYALGFQSGLYQSYQSTNPGDVIEIAHIPTLEFSSVERPLNLYNLMYSYDVATEGLSRNEVGFDTAPVVGRVDAHPSISLPTFLHGWTFRPEAGVRETYYTQRLQSGGGVAVGTAISDSINRNVFSTAIDIRPPTLSKIFERKFLGYVMKHTVEPQVVYRYQTGIDNFDEIIRFDQRDILADTNEVEYGVVNRLFAKKTKSNSECFHHPKYALPSQGSDFAAKKDTDKTEPGTCDDTHGPAREVITWKIAQKYFFDPTFGGALVPGQRNVFDSTVDFSGIAFLTEPRHFSPIISRLRAQDAQTDFQWDLDYDPVLHQVNASTLLVGQRFGSSGQWYVAGGQTYMVEPAETAPISGQPSLGISIYNQYRIQVQYGNIGQRGLSTAAAVAVDSRLNYVQTATVQTNYNWDCCGVTFEYSRYAFAPTVSQENSYRFSFSLANIGSFGTIRRLQRLY
ncbi:MAG: LPS assembly protein LptD [Candidatus Korobacteraceae bacterium]